jgi:preprotein translocase subunit SecD
MKKIFLLLAVCLATTLIVVVAAETVSQSVFQMRLVDEQPSKDTEQLTYQQKPRNETDKPLDQILNVQKKVLIDQSAIEFASASTNSIGHRWDIVFKLNPDGKKRFAEVTRENIGKRLAIIVDGKVLTAPTILDEISVGSGQITGSYTEKEAKEIAAKLQPAKR